MTRSIKKNPFVANHLSAKIEKLNIREEKEIIVTWSRASTIIPTMIGKKGSNIFSKIQRYCSIKDSYTLRQNRSLIHL